MELPNSAYLYTLALIAVGFAGFSAIVLFLRQSVGSTLSSLDALVARLFMTRGFMITYLSMLPIVLAAFDLSQSTVWRISSALAGVSLALMHLGYQILRRRITGEPTPLHLWFYTGSGLALGIVLIVNSVAIAPAAVGAIYVAAVTLDMIQASIAFVQHFGFMIDQLGQQAKDRN
jgi:hypothetical protein